MRKKQAFRWSWDVLRLNEFSAKDHHLLLNIMTSDLGPVEITEGPRLSVLMIGWTICSPATRGDDDQKLQGLKSNVYQTSILWWMSTIHGEIKLNTVDVENISMNIYPRFHVGSTAPSLCIFCGDFCSINRYPPVISPWPNPLHLNHRLIRICVLCPVAGVLLRSKNRCWWWSWQLVVPLNKFQGTIGCTPNSVPMFSTDSWGV